MKREREGRLAKLKAELHRVEAAIESVRSLHTQAGGVERDRLGEILCRLHTVRESIRQSLLEVEPAGGGAGRGRAQRPKRLGAPLDGRRPPASTLY